MVKQRSMGKVMGDIFAGDVAGGTIIVLDDLISTGTSMARVAAACRARGSGNIHLAATHGVFPAALPPSLRKPGSPIVVTDSITLPRLDAQSIGGRLVVLSAASLFAEAISRSHTGGSIVELLEKGH